MVSDSTSSKKRKGKERGKQLEFKYFKQLSIFSTAKDTEPKTLRQLRKSKRQAQASESFPQEPEFYEGVAGSSSKWYSHRNQRGSDGMII